ncbi:class I SAM-dependent methyltransferase [Congregibacter sp.]|nr:class I SAM-dependent methyltransferase [Congregibacter sp.]MDA8962008.1 class I SAM-dependent methyltransferase [Congregibacter sp.]
MVQQEFNKAYIGPRPEVAALVPTESRSILDVGCSVGSLGAALKERSGAAVTGVEFSPEMSIEAAKKLDAVHTGDAEVILAGDLLGEASFDCMVFADILEHLREPWDALSNAAQRLEPGGSVVASLPNIRHVDTLFHQVVLGRWPYRERGIHDRTHLRFFTRKNIVELFEGAGLRIEKMERVYRIVEKPHRLNRIAPLIAMPFLPWYREFFVFQYLVRARKSG